MTTQDPAGWTAWDDLYAEFPTHRDAKIRALISKHQCAIEEQAAAEARRELLAKVEQLDVDLLTDAIVIAVRAERAPIGGRGDGWPAYSERGLPATVLNVSLLAKRLATEYRRLMEESR